MKFFVTLFALAALVSAAHALALSGCLSSILGTSRLVFGHQQEKRSGLIDERSGGRSSSSRNDGSNGVISDSTQIARAEKPESRTSNAGGMTRSGSGLQPLQYSEDGRFYDGGAEVPYRAGIRSPRGVQPTLMPASNLDFYPGFGLWPFGVYIYQFANPYTYEEAAGNKKETKPVDCLCGQYQECGCDQVDANQTAYIDSIANNHTISHVAEVMGKLTLIINGTLPNGTMAASAATASGQSKPATGIWWTVLIGAAVVMWLV